jgi:Mg2+ and Co2+ transporter CorA
VATIADIQAQQQQAVTILDRKIADAIQAQNTAPASQAAQLAQVVQDLQNQRQAVYTQTLAAIQNSADMANALAALSAATTNMNNVAGQMTSATTIINNAAALIGAAGNVVTALSG